MLKTHSDHPAGCTAATQNYGFSLITVSVLLTVAALVFVSMLPGQESGDVNQKNINNAKKLERVEEAMRSFMAVNGRRPCPADGQYAENTKYFGVEAGTPGTCTGNTAPTPNAPLGPDAGTGFVVGGVIPTKTLGLQDEYQYDDYGRRFTYIVDVRATESPAAAITNNNAIIAASATNTHPPGCYNLQQSIKYPNATNAAADAPAITIKNTTGAGTTVIDHTMVAYISHGASGYGAWPASGSLTTLTSAQSVARRINSGSTDADMQVNAGVDHPGVGGTFTYNTTNFTNVKIQKDRVISTLPSGGADTGFDDMVWYRPDTKNTCCLGTACLQAGFVVPQPTTAARCAPTPVAIGDVNGDGIPDLIIAESGECYTAVAVEVIFGTPLGFPDPLPVGSLNGSNGFVINNAASISTSVAVGDVNGDGIGDIIIGDIWGFYHTYVIFGHRGTWPASQTLNNNLVNGQPLAGYGTLIDGIQGVAFDATNLASFRSLVATGDINGDGYADVIMGFPNANSIAGYTYVYFGKQTGNTVGTTNTLLPNTTITTNGTTGATVASNAGLQVGQYLSASSIPAGTTITACSATGTGACGSTSITLSAAATASTTVPVVVAVTPTNIGAGTQFDGTQGVRFDGVTANDVITTGYSVAAGDINDDGYADVIIGAPGALQDCVGAAYVVFGKSASWGSAGNLLLNIGYNTLIDGIQGFRIDAAPSGGCYLLGASSETVGDFNGDGIPDLALGAPGLGVAVIFGKNTGGNTFLPSTTITTTNTSPTATLTSYTGIVSGQFLNSVNVPAGTYISDCVGTAISWPGWEKICTGALTLSGSATVTGAAPVTVASVPPIVNTGTGTIFDGTQGVEFIGPDSGGPQMEQTDFLGLGVAIGDVNGDGIGDLIMGAPSYVGTTHGYVYVLFGKKGSWGAGGVIDQVGNNMLNSSLIDGTHGFRIDGTIVGSFFGGSVAAGDINGDGIADIAMSGNDWPWWGAEGTTYVLFGHKTNPLNPWPTPNMLDSGL